jgi:hypothetical protein
MPKRPDNWLTWEEAAELPTQISLIFDPVEPEPETAEDRRKGFRVIEGGKGKGDG